MNIKSSSLLILLLLILFCAAILTGCANLKISMGLVQHAVGGLYDPTDQIAEDQLNAILETAVAQDVAAIKAQFAPNAIAAQPELDDQIEALLDYYAEKSWEIDSPGCMTMDSSNADGTGGRVSSFQMHGMILTDRFYRFSLRGISVDTKIQTMSAFGHCSCSKWISLRTMRIVWLVKMTWLAYMLTSQRSNLIMK